MMVVTGILGYALSTSAFLLNELISATSIMVINNANKLEVILLSELCMERSLGPLSTARSISLDEKGDLLGELWARGAASGGGVQLDG